MQKIQYGNDSLSLSEWSQQTQIPYSVLYARYRAGWDIGRMLTTPVKQPLRVQVNGEDKTVSELATELGVNRTALYERIRTELSESGTLKSVENLTKIGVKRLASKNFKQQVFDAIVQYKQAHDGISPSVRDIADSIGSGSTSHIKWTLVELQHDGLISFFKSQPRTIQVTGGKWELNNPQESELEVHEEATLADNVGTVDA